MAVDSYRPGRRRNAKQQLRRPGGEGGILLAARDIAAALRFIRKTAPAAENDLENLADEAGSHNGGGAMWLFLDYDGVLHRSAVYLEIRQDGSYPVLRGKGELFMWSHHLVEILEPYPAVRIVLSTAWVPQYGFDRARDELPEALSSRAVGATRLAAFDEGGDVERRQQIEQWHELTRYEQIRLYAKRARPEPWVAVDDDSYGWGAADAHRFVQIDPSRGLSDPKAQARLKALLKR